MRVAVVWMLVLRVPALVVEKVGMRRRPLDHHHMGRSRGLVGVTRSGADVEELAHATLHALRGDEAALKSQFAGRNRTELLGRVFEGRERVSRSEAAAVFEALAEGVIRDLAGEPGSREASVFARSLLAGGGEKLAEAKAQIGGRLWDASADVEDEEEITQREVARLMDAMLMSREGTREVLLGANAPTKLRSLDEVVGQLQLLPRLGTQHAKRDRDSCEWHSRVPGDGHVLQRWDTGKGFSVVGIGRSADASAYYLPELGVVFDAGLAVKSLVPKTVLLSHGHRDHIQALPALARRARFGGATLDAKPATRVVVPASLADLVADYLQAEAVLNYGRAQTRLETEKALGKPDIVAAIPGDDIELPKHAYVGKGPLHVEVFEAKHKTDMPALSYGLYRSKKRLKPEYLGADPSVIKANRDLVTETVREYLIFYSGDTQISLLAGPDGPAILRHYPCVLHECTFLGLENLAASSPDYDDALDAHARLDARARDTGHTHYLQLHPIIVAHPHVTFILVHFSTKYSRSDVYDFFQSAYGGVPDNVVLWI